MNFFSMALLALSSVAAHAQTVTYQLDPAQSWVQFELLHFGTSTVRGRLGPARGDITLQRDASGAWTAGRAQVLLDAASIDTGVKVFDARIHEADLLDAPGHPDIGLVAERFVFTADGRGVRELRGELTLRGRSLGLTLRALRFACRHDALRQAEVCGGDFEGEMLRSEVGATFGLPFIADRVRLLVQVEALRRD